MKKLLIIFAFLLSIVGVSAQTYSYRAYEFAQKNVGYSWSNFVSSNIRITINFDTDVVKIHNKLNSEYYVLTSESYKDRDGDDVVKCVCVDEERLNCTIRFVMRRNGTSQVYVDYSNVSWCWNVRREY